MSEVEEGSTTKRRKCNYNADWQKKYNWVSEGYVGNKKSNSKARCKLCNVTFTVMYDGIKVLTQHAASKKHIEAETVATSSQRLTSFFASKDNSQSDAVALAELLHIYHGVKHHLSYLAQECGIKIIKQSFSDSQIAKNVTAGRTKASAVVQNILYPFSIELVIEDLKNNVPFSIATDASNKGNRKLFPVAIQFYSLQNGLSFKILDFYEDAFEDSRSIKDQLCRVLNENGLNWKNITAYGADYSSVNYGVNNSVFQKLVKEENKTIIAAHCNDHIIHNCAKNALKLLSFDIENVILKVFAEFSNSAKKRENLKECYDFYESEFHEVVRHSPTRWLSLFKAVDRLLLSWQPLKYYFLTLGKDECPTPIWTMISDQEHEISPLDEPTISEIYIYFVHSFMSFQKILLILETRTTLACDLYLISVKFRESLKNKMDTEFFGMKVKFAMMKNYLDPCQVNKFKKEALNVYARALNYLEKWFDLRNSPYMHFQTMSLADGKKSISLDEILKIWMLSPMKDEVPPDCLHTEICALNSVMETLEGTSSLEKWNYFFQKESAPNLLKLAQFVFSIPVSNANVERIFSVMGNLWTNERNRMSLNLLKSELCIFFNIPYTCQNIREIFSKNKKLLKATSQNEKYKKNQK